MLEVLEKSYKQQKICEIGLTDEQAQERIKIDGYNKLASEKKRSTVKLFAGQFKDILVMILLVSTVISVFLGEIYDAITIILIVLMNAILGFIQEFKTEKTLEALKNMTAPTARVYRNGVIKVIPADEMVKDDIFEIEAGDKVPCDGQIIISKGLFADESILTGEAIAVEKKINENSKIFDTLNLSHVAYMGTIVTRGNARCKAVATGMNSQMGKVSGMLEEIIEEDTPLQKKLAELGKIIAIICLGVCGIVFLAGILRGEPVFDMLMTGITIAIAAIPEGLPATVTIALALSVSRMLKRNALVHKLHSVETLGCASVICSDKTGTITENRMTVTKIITQNNDFEVLGSGYRIAGEIQSKGLKIENRQIPNLDELLICACLCNNAKISKPRLTGVRSFQASIARSEWAVMGDPTEVAMLVTASKLGITLEKLNVDYNRIDEIPFESEARCMKVICEDKSGNKICFVKGAIDVILAQCKYIETPSGIKAIEQHDKKQINQKADGLASDALRVLAFAYCRLEDMMDEKNTMPLTFLGIMGMLDPLRTEAKQAIKTCERANIKTVMITGDHKATACAIATQAGIMKPNSKALTGEELSRLSNAQLDDIIDDIGVFARVNPADKLRIVRAFKRKGHIVAMTGDGVNDAPAIKEADIGVSMGISGTDVTKQASDVILLDDNFATLVDAVEQGRTIYSNIRKFVRYLISCNIGEVVTMFVGIIMGLPMVLLPTQILLVNLVTDGLPAVALGLEPTEKAIMKKQPRKSTDGFFSDGLMSRIIFRGILIGLCTLASFVTMARLGFNLNIARTAALLTLVVSQLIHVFECKSEEKNIFTVPYFNNIFMVLAVIVSGVIVISAIYIPILQLVFSTVPLTIKQVVISVLYAMAVPILAVVFNIKPKKAPKLLIKK